MTKAQTIEPGTIISGTMRPEDLIPAFIETLGRVDGNGVLAARFQEEYDDISAAIERGNQEVLPVRDDLLSDLFDTLDALAPEGCYFGAHPGDGSDYGFWPVEDDGEEEGEA